MERANLSGANLNEAILYGAKFPGANLNGASLRNALISNTDFSGATLRHANMEGFLVRARDGSGNYFVGQESPNTAILETSFKEADLTGTRLLGRSLRENNLSGATTTLETSFGSAQIPLPASEKQAFRTLNIPEDLWPETIPYQKVDIYGNQFEELKGPLVVRHTRLENNSFSEAAFKQHGVYLDNTVLGGNNRVRTNELNEYGTPLTRSLTDAEFQRL